MESFQNVILQKTDPEALQSEIAQTAARVLQLLGNKKMTLSACESCTGGLFASAITDVPGASAVFDRSLVTYCEKAKMEELGVLPQTLQKYSAVSRQTAAEMAEGLFRASGSDVCVSVTGYAGPGGGTAEDPVGTFYAGLHYGGSCLVCRCFLADADRSTVRKTAVLQMLRMICDLFSDYY